MLLATAVLAGCGDPRPSRATLDHIEAMLVRSPCVGSLERWSRHYAFQRRDERIDTGIVWIILMEAGHQGFGTGRYTNSRVFDMIDDSQFRVAFGQYEVAGDRIRHWSCGSNYPATAPGEFPESPRPSGGQPSPGGGPQ